MRIRRATKAMPPKTALVMMSWDDRSLMGIPHMAFVVFIAAGHIVSWAVE